MNKSKFNGIGEWRTCYACTAPREHLDYWTLRVVLGPGPPSERHPLSTWILDRSIRLDSCGTVEPENVEYPSRLFVDFQYRRNHGDDKLWQRVCHYLRSAPVFRLKRSALFTDVASACAHVHTEKSRKRATRIKIDVSKEKRKQIFLYAFVFSHLRNSKQALTWSHVSDRPGPKSRVAGILSHLRLSFFCFTFFFCVVVGGLLLLLKKFQRALFRYCHTHTHDRPLVGGTGRPAFGGQYDL